MSWGQSSEEFQLLFSDWCECLQDFTSVGGLLHGNCWIGWWEAVSYCTDLVSKACYS